jgi:hypothetical protein
VIFKRAIERLREAFAQEADPEIESGADRGDDAELMALAKEIVGDVGAVQA